jgi:hypothetical protein
MSDSSLAVQGAVYTKLIAGTSFTNLVGTRLYDHVPVSTDPATFPYVEIGESTGESFDTKTELGFESTVVLHTWSRYRGRKETKQIQAAIYGLLHRGTLSVTGFTHINSEHEFTEVFSDPDGLTYHGIQRFRVVTQN